MRPGDRLYLYSDGIQETVNDAAEEFGMERCKSSLLDARDLLLQENLERLSASLDQWRKGDPLQDDVTILGLEYRGSQGL